MIKNIKIHLFLLYVCFIIVLIFSFFDRANSNINESRRNKNLLKDYPKITRNDVTWYFDREYQRGKFANGDWWIIGPVKIIGIDPESINYNNRIINGSMINPSVDGNHGFDSKALGFNAELNVAKGISPKNPLSVKPGSSLISIISLIPPASHTYLKSGEILTVLSKVPAEGSFRPPYTGNDKTILYNKNQLNYSLLRSLEPVKATPSLNVVEGYFKRPWIDFRTLWSGELIHPTDNMPAYGREFANNIGIGALMLHINFPKLKKEKLLISYVQIGIDFYNIMKNGKGWKGEGGFGSGRKWPIIFAGLILDDKKMQRIGKKSGDYAYTANPRRSDLKKRLPHDYIHFGEDDQTFYVTNFDVIRSKSKEWRPDKRQSTEPYNSKNIGMPEWGIRHVWHPNQDNQHWSASYRQCCTAIAWQGSILSALIMGAKPLWNHDALFDYIDRYMSITKGDPDPFEFKVSGEGSGWRAWSKFVENMWDEYRKDYRKIKD